MHFEGEQLHRYPDSKAQEAEQPSPEIVLLSSHCSVPVMAPSPQRTPEELLRAEEEKGREELRAEEEAGAEEEATAAIVQQHSFD
jgi:hypothetical protein